MAENQHELADDKAAMARLKEAFAVWRSFDELEINRGSLRHLARTASLYYLGGKLMTRIGKFREARDAFARSETAYRVYFESDPSIGDKRAFARLYLTMGDLNSGSGVCSFQNSPIEGFANQGKYCPSEIIGVPTGDISRLAASRKYYQNGIDILSEIGSKYGFEDKDGEDIRIAREKLAVCDQKLNGS